MILDTSELDSLPRDFREFGKRALGLLQGVGLQALQKEIPKALGKLRASVKPDLAGMQSTLTVSAIQERPTRPAIAIYPSGAQKTIELRPTGPFDYAAAVAEGTGVFGPRGTSIVPTHSQYMLVPEQYGEGDDPHHMIIVEERGRFVLRKSVRGQKANPYDVRTQTQIAESLETVVNQAWP